MGYLIKLILPTSVPLLAGETALSGMDATMDTVVVYKRENAYSISEVTTVSLGVPEVDVTGLVNDEYYITFRHSATGIESQPSSIYRALNPYKQRQEPEAPVSVILQLETTSTVPTVDFIGVYRRKYGESISNRIALLPIGTEYFQDPDGLPGDVYHSTFIDSTNATESQPSIYVIANANAGLVIVSGRFEYPNGDPVISQREPKHDIDIELIIPKSSQGRTPTAQGQVIASRTAKVFLERISKDELGNAISPEIDTGRWSVALVPNNLIEPNDTYYEFTFNGNKMYKKIHSQNGLAQNFAMLAEVTPRFYQ